MDIASYLVLGVLPVLFCVRINVPLLYSNWNCFLEVFLFDFAVRVLVLVHSLVLVQVFSFPIAVPFGWPCCSFFQ